MKASTLFYILVCVLLIPTGCQRSQVDAMTGATRPAAVIVQSDSATQAERLAAKEIRRYLYLRTGKLFPIVQTNSKLPIPNPDYAGAQK